MIGLEPTAADARFVASIEMVESVPKLTWSPDLGSERVYRVLGAKSLVTPVREDTDPDWIEAEIAEGRTVWEVVTAQLSNPLQSRLVRYLISQPHF